MKRIQATHDFRHACFFVLNLQVAGYLFAAHNSDR